MREADHSLFAALVIDAGGRIVAANTSARELWATRATPLVNRPLFELVESAADESESEAAQWVALKNAALDRMIATYTRPVGGGERRAVQMRLERAHGGGGSYIATLVGA